MQWKIYLDNPGIYMFQDPYGNQYIGKAVNIEKRIFSYDGDGNNIFLDEAIKRYEGQMQCFALQIFNPYSINHFQLDNIETQYIKMRNTIFPYGFNIQSKGIKNEVIKYGNVLLRHYKFLGATVSQIFDLHFTPMGMRAFYLLIRCNVLPDIHITSVRDTDYEYPNKDKYYTFCAIMNDLKNDRFKTKTI